MCTGAAVFNFLHRRGGFAKSWKFIAPAVENAPPRKSSKTDRNLTVLTEKVRQPRAESPLFSCACPVLPRRHLEHNLDVFRTAPGRSSDASRSLLGRLSDAPRTPAGHSSDARRTPFRASPGGSPGAARDHPSGRIARLLGRLPDSESHASRTRPSLPTLRCVDVADTFRC